MKYFSRTQIVPYGRNFKVVYVVNSNEKVIAIGARLPWQKSHIYQCPVPFELLDRHFFAEVPLSEAQRLVPGINALQE